MKLIFSILIFSGAFCSAIDASTKTPSNKKEICEATREYVTTIEYLRDKKDFGLKANEIINLADKISMGCSGASQRFIKIANLLTKVGIDSASSLSHAVKFSVKSDEFVDAFIMIFNQTYSPKNLDLDALNSLNISLQLTLEFSGHIQNAVKDFDQLVNFCKARKEMDFPLPQCAQLATSITRLGQDYADPIATAFIDLVKFLEESSQGPKLPKLDVIKIAKEVLKYGPIASKNFINAYKYAIKEKGLAMTESQAIAFGKKMAERSFRKQ